jgi:hypothetical protein
MFLCLAIDGEIVITLYFALWIFSFILSLTECEVDSDSVFAKLVVLQREKKHSKDYARDCVGKDYNFISKIDFSKRIEIVFYFRIVNRMHTNIERINVQD